MSYTFPEVNEALPAVGGKLRVWMETGRKAICSLHCSHGHFPAPPGACRPRDLRSHFLQAMPATPKAESWRKSQTQFVQKGPSFLDMQML